MITAPLHLVTVPLPPESALAGLLGGMTRVVIPGVPVVYTNAAGVTLRASVHATNREPYTITVLDAATPDPDAYAPVTVPAGSVSLDLSHHLGLAWGCRVLRCHVGFAPFIDAKLVNGILNRWARNERTHMDTAQVEHLLRHLWHGAPRTEGR